MVHDVVDCGKIDDCERWVPSIHSYHFLSGVRQTDQPSSLVRSGSSQSRADRSEGLFSRRNSGERGKEMNCFGLTPKKSSSDQS